MAAVSPLAVFQLPSIGSAASVAVAIDAKSAAARSLRMNCLPVDDIAGGISSQRRPSEATLAYAHVNVNGATDGSLM